MAGLLGGGGGGGGGNNGNKGLVGGLLGTVDDTTKGIPIVGGITSPLLQTVGGVTDALPIVGSGGLGGLGGPQAAQQPKLNAWGEPIKTGPKTTYQPAPRQTYTAPQASASASTPAVKKTVPKKVAAPKVAPKAAPKAALAATTKTMTPEQKKKRLLEIKKQQLALEAAELEDD